MNTPQASDNSVGPKGVIFYAAALLSLAALLESKNPQDPTGQTGFQLRDSGTTALVDREAHKHGITVQGNFGQDAGY